MDDDLHRPLGRDRGEMQGSRLARIRPRHVAAAILALAVTAVAALFALAPRGPLEATLGGRPYALAKIEPYAPPAPEPPAKPAEVANAPAGSPVQLRSVDDHARATSEVEVQNGVRILRAGGGGGANPLIIRVEPEPSVRVSAIPQTTPAPTRQERKDPDPTRKRISAGP